MTTPLPELFAAVAALNDPKEPFAYAVEGDTIVGTWDIVKATSLYPAALKVESIDEDYAITVTFDIDEGTFDFTERKTSTIGTADAGRGTFHKDFFSGKSSSKQFSASFGGVRKTDDGVTAEPLVYSFETSRIKEPLFTFLEQHGWQRKKGFLGRLFNR